MDQGLTTTHPMDLSTRVHLAGSASPGCGRGLDNSAKDPPPLSRSRSATRGAWSRIYPTMVRGWTVQYRGVDALGRRLDIAASGCFNREMEEFEVSNWNTVNVTSPEGWHEVHVRTPEGVAVYKETAEVDEHGRAVFEFVETRS